VPRHIDEQVLTHDLEEEDGTTHLVDTERFSLKPMYVDEAVLQLELVDHRQFLVFLNADSEKLSVLYKRKNGHFGLIEPSLT